MNKKQLGSLSESLSKAINPVSRKIEATSRILEKVEPLPVTSPPAEIPGQVQKAEMPATSECRDHPPALTPEDDCPHPPCTDMPVENTLVKMTTVATDEPSGWPKSTVAKMTTLGNLTEVKGELRIPNTIIDSLLPILEPAAAVLYLRLFRLSYGYKRDTCIVGLQKLAIATNTSQKTVQRAIEQLERLQLIQRVGAVFGGKMKGNQFKVNLPTLANMTIVKTATAAKMTTLANLTAVATLTSNKTDDESNTNHHQKARDSTSPHLTQTISTYTQVTGNSWLDADMAAYSENRIDRVPIERIKAVIQALVERSGGRINSFNYFVKELLALKQARNVAQQRKALAEIVRRVRENHVGLAGYSPPDFIYDVKAACARDGVVFDNDLFNEVLRGENVSVP